MQMGFQHHQLAAGGFRFLFLFFFFFYLMLFGPGFEPVASLSEA